MKKTEVIDQIYGNLLEKITGIFSKARATVVREINAVQVMAYFEIGREIVEFEQHGKPRADYGEELIIRLSKDMSERFGRGFSARSLRNMRAFYMIFSIRQTVSAESETQTGLSKPFFPCCPGPITVN